jgi:3-phenylpropionate/cinnamic acid dioxygenase small subunit
VEPWELAAREEIRELVARYAHFADGGRFDELTALFAEDAELRIDDRPALRGRDAIRAFLGGTRDDLAASPAVHTIRHHVTSHRIDVTARDAATGACYFLVLSDQGPDHWGRYRDRYVVRDGAWRFAERRVRVDGTAPGSWAAARRSGPR